MDSKRSKAAHRRLMEKMDRAQSWIHSTLADTINLELTHEQMLASIAKLHETDWYKSMPQWARSECYGYERAMLGAHYGSRLAMELRTGHVFEGKLYTSFDQWRKEHPDHPGGRIGPCVSFWRNTGKIHAAYLDKPREGEVVSVDYDLVGKVFPRAAE